MPQYFLAKKRVPSVIHNQQRIAAYTVFKPSLTPTVPTSSNPKTVEVHQPLEYPAKQYNEEHQSNFNQTAELTDNNKNAIKDEGDNNNKNNPEQNNANHGTINEWLNLRQSQPYTKRQQAVERRQLRSQSKRKKCIKVFSPNRHVQQYIHGDQPYIF